MLRIRQDRLYVLLWSALVIVAGLALASVAANYQASSERAQRHAQFRHEADLVFNAIQQQVAAGTQLVRSVQASIQVSEDLDQAEFEKIYESLNPKAVFPGLQAMVYSSRSVDAAGQPHYLTAFVAPVGGNERLQGLDLVSQPRNMVAVARSEATGQPAMSEPFSLIQDEGLAPGRLPLGMTIRAPVYGAGSGKEKVVVGSFGISFHIDALISAALPPRDESGVAVEMFDVSGPTPRLIYAMGLPDNRAATQEEKMEAAGRWWVVRLTPMANAAPASLWPVLTFSSIVLASMLVSMLVYNLLSTRSRAIKMAGEMTNRFRQSEERFRLLNENLPGLVVLADNEGNICYANRSCRERMGVQEQEKERTVMDIFAVPALIERLHALPEGVAQMQLPRVRLADASGVEFWASLSFTHMDIGGAPHILALGSDVSEIIDMSEQLDFQAKQLHFQATHDQLTGLNNRREMESRLAAAIVEAGQGVISGLLYVDLDQFKVINDTAGHMVGDRLLVQAAEGMRSLLFGDELMARMGGDEFAVLLRNTSPHHAQHTAERIRKFFEDFSFNWEGVPYHVSCSIGGVMIDDGSMSQEDVLSRADAACYMAKDRGRNRWQFFDQNDESAARRLEMEWVGRIRQAIASKRMRLYYQDIVPITANAADGAHFEILVRMEDENGRLVPAGEFIPAAERYGLMSMIDKWVVETSIRNFDKLHPSGKVAICAINLSGETVDNKEFEDFLIEELTRNPEAASRICIEITETSLIRNMERLQQFIPRLRATGCRLALDDFGAGQSSFGYLKNLHVDIIKIDGSFIRDLDHDAMSNSIVSAVTDIAHKMDMEVVAEWVSSKAILNLLRQMGVNYVQGFYLHKPAPCPLDM